MTTTAASPALANGVHTLEFAHRILERMLEGFPEDKWTHQPWPGANHALWIVGHSAVSDDYFLVAIAGRTRLCPEPWNDLFGMGSEPRDDPSAYPPIEEVRRMAGATRAALIEWFRSLDDATLAEELVEELRPFAPTKGALMSTLGAHGCMHAGQLSALRRAIGLPRIMG